MTVVGNVTSGGSFIIGSASMSEADLEQLDGITAGTVAASKAVVVDSNKDASSFRNITASGTVTFGSLADGTITVTAWVDEDNMASDSATLVPTQQSVKAYVDAAAGAKAGYNNSGKHGQWVDGTDNYDLAQSESGITTTVTDAFGISTVKNLDQIDPVGDTDTVDMGTGESNVA